MTVEMLETTWEKILNSLKNTVGDKAFSVWFSYFQPKNYSQQILKIEVPSKFVKDWLERKFKQIILKTIKEFVPEVKNIEFVISPNPNVSLSYRKRSIKRVSVLSQKQLSIFEVNPQTNLNPRYRFDNFVVGPCNELAFAACQGVAKSFGKIHNPLFVYGPVGVGKTHLLQATGNEALRIHKNIKLK